MLGNDLTKRIYGLDIMRCIAIMLVVIHHSGLYMPSGIYNNYVDPLIFADGVDIFFILSGFLIGQILIKTFAKDHVNKKDLLKFWTNRWFRTLPLYFFVLILLTLFADTTSASNRLWTYYVFLQNLFWSCPGFFGETWSLAIEEWFYLLIPLFIYLFKKAGVPVKRSIPYVVLIVILSALAARIFNYSGISAEDFSYHFFDKAIRKQVLTRLDSILLGVLGAYLMTYNYHQLKTGSGAVYKIISYISIISYSLYLANLTPVGEIIAVINSHYELSMTAKHLLFYTLTFGIATVTYKLIEQPSLKQRAKFNKKFFEKATDPHS